MCISIALPHCRDRDQIAIIKSSLAVASSGETVHAGRIEVLVKPVALRRRGLGRLTIQVTVTVTRTY